jgi:hypothetical protein
VTVNVGSVDVTAVPSRVAVIGLVPTPLAVNVAVYVPLLSSVA